MRRAIAAPVMADAMVRRKTTEREAIRKEEELLVFARSYLSDAFPNPERTGCPPDDALRLMAIRPLESDESVSEHLTCCSPCFNAYMGHLAQARAKIRRTTSIRRSAAALGIAAILVIVAYVFLANHRNAPIVAPGNPAPITTPGRPDQTQTAVMYVPVLIDLSNASPTRGSKQSTARSVPAGHPFWLTRGSEPAFAAWKRRAPLPDNSEVRAKHRVVGVNASAARKW